MNNTALRNAGSWFTPHLKQNCQVHIIPGNQLRCCFHGIFTRRPACLCAWFPCSQEGCMRPLPQSLADAGRRNRQAEGGRGALT